jgi:hypothetical protein
MRRLLLAAFLLLATAACVSADLHAVRYYALPAEQVAQLEGGSMGAVIVDLQVGSPCSHIELRYRNLDTGVTWRRSIVRTFTSDQVSSFDAGAIPTTIVLPVGTYAFVGGQCIYSTGSYSYGITTYTISLDDMAFWLRPFSIGAGEIVYTGTATPELLTYRYGAEPGLVARVLLGSTRSADSYNLFEVIDNSEAVRASLEQYNPGLGARFVSRVSPALIDKEFARRVINEAYAEAASAPPPDAATAEANSAAARARVDAALRAHVLERLRQEGVAVDPLADAGTPK